MFKFAWAFLLCGLLVSTLTAADQNSLVDVRSEEEALQRAFNEDDGAEIGQLLKRVQKTKPVLPEAKEIRIITDQIWAADKNRFSNSDVVYNVGIGKPGEKFFTYVNEARLTGTYAKMIDLFDIGTTESCGQDCRNKENAFLDAILNTRPIQMARDWLVTKGLASTDTFKEKLHQYWFKPYIRSTGQPATSGFKHTYLGEIYNGDFGPEVKGLHNWVRMYIEEREGRLTYMRSIRRCPPFIEAIAFDWKPIQTTKFYYKYFNTAFIRTSPEVEIALYTICLLTRNNVNCNIQLNNNRLTMSVSTRTQGGQETINSAYPIC